jgi:hypothetical protein
MAAENPLDTLVYRGENTRYNFETHVSMHRKSHLELEKATEVLMELKLARIVEVRREPTMKGAQAVQVKVKVMP